MRKYKNLLLALVIFVGVLALTGCTGEGEKKDKEKTTTIIYNYGKYNVSFDVPQDEEGNAKYSFTTTKPEGFNRSGAFYLELDNSYIAIGSSSWVYQTSVYYKEKYGVKDPSFDDYLEWMKDAKSGIKLGGMENLEINGRKAIRYYAREGSSNNYKYYGYNYIFSLDDINPKSRLDVIVYYKDETPPTEAKEFDEQTLKILKTLKVEENK